jgi:hypothetical protein
MPRRAPLLCRFGYSEDLEAFSGRYGFPARREFWDNVKTIAATPEKLCKSPTLRRWFAHEFVENEHYLLEAIRYIRKRSASHIIAEFLRGHDRLKLPSGKRIDVRTAPNKEIVDAIQRELKLSVSIALVKRVRAELGRRDAPIIAAWRG